MIFLRRIILIITPLAAADKFLDEVGVPYEDEGNFVSWLTL